MTPRERIFVALDTTDETQAVRLARSLTGLVGGAKIGKEFFTANGPAGVRAVSDVGLPVFIDLKWHDISNTVAGAVRAALSLKPSIVNIHAAGGGAMIRAAVEAATEGGENRPLVLAVTVLTSMDNRDLRDIGVTTSTGEQVVRLARLARENGADGVVCSAMEIEVLRAACGPDFKLLVPGIRPSWSVTGDQKRVMTPRDAVERGADYLVIGRPITAADDPVAAARRIGEELR